MHTFHFTPFLLLLACSDPAERYKPPPTDGRGETVHDAPGEVPGDGSNAPPPGAASGSGGGGGAEGCQASDMALSAIPIAEGKGVTLSGTLQSAAQGGPVLIEVVRLDGKVPLSVYHFECQSSSTLSMKAPPDLGEVYLVAFADTAGDGPSTDDPAGFVGPFKVGTKDIDGLDLVLTANADLGPVGLPHQVSTAEGGGGERDEGDEVPVPLGADAEPPEGDAGPDAEAGDAPPPDGNAPPDQPDAAGEPPAGDPPAGDPPAGDPPAGDPPAGDAPPPAPGD